MTDEPNAVDDVVAQALAEAQSQVSVMQGELDAAGGALPGGATGIDMLGDVDLQVTVELGRTEMLVEDVLKLGNGSVVELDKLAGDPVDVFVNGRLVARGEVLVLNDSFCIRISEIVSDVEESPTDEAEVPGDAEPASAEVAEA